MFTHGEAREDLLRGPPSPNGSAAGSSQRRSPELSPEADGASDTGRRADEERDELEEDVDEDASVSTDRARSSEPIVTGTASVADSAAPSVVDRPGVTAVPQAQGTKTQAAFVHKVWAMLETPSLHHLISWSEDGTSFIIHHPSEFARLILPQYFKHSNFSSFIRQQNFYGFAKCSDSSASATNVHTNPDGSTVQSWEFRNPNFIRDRPELLTRIKRKTAKSSTANTSPSSVKRRSSITNNSSQRGSRRSSLAGAEPDLESDLEPTKATNAGTYGSAGAATAPPPPRRIAAGLADFAPYSADEGRRVKEEVTELPPGLRSPPATSHSRYAASTLSGVANPPNRPSCPNFSPNGRSSYLPPAGPPPPNPRYAPLEETLGRQVHTLEGQVRELAQALYHTQNEAAVFRSTSYGVMHSLLSLTASMDLEGRRKEEIEACSFALSKLGQDSVPQYCPQGNMAYPQYGNSTSSAWSAFYGPPANPFYSPRPSTAASHQFYYNRVPAAESYARSSRPDLSTAPFPPSQPLGDSRPPSSAAISYATMTAAPSLSSHPTSTSSSFDASSAAKALPPPAPGTALPPMGQPMPSTASIAASYPHGYPSPRSSWPGLGVAGGAVGEPGGGGAGASTKLPPLSSLLNPSAGPPTFSRQTNGERRSLEGGMGEDERAKKKMRQ
ncbi:hypothetical protein JCM11641_008159 [Rhodosporidiobolus odoratus]